MPLAAPVTPVATSPPRWARSVPGWARSDPSYAINRDLGVEDGALIEAIIAYTDVVPATGPTAPLAGSGQFPPRASGPKEADRCAETAEPHADDGNVVVFVGHGGASR